MVKNGLDPTLLDDPDAPMGKQAGINNLPLMNDAYETGLRYCLDTKKDPFDWRHKTYEVYFDCRGKNVFLESVSNNILILIFIIFIINILLLLILFSFIIISIYIYKGLSFLC
jgi:hypothetical protein